MLSNYILICGGRQQVKIFASPFFMTCTNFKDTGTIECGFPLHYKEVDL
jgi:hypothetical protein